MRNKQAGFTLVEVLVASAILAVTLGAIYTVFWNAWKAGERKSAEINMSARAAIDLIAGDLRSACFQPDISEFALVGDDVSAGRRSADRLAFCTVDSSAETGAISGARPVRVEYFLSEHPGTGEVALYRTMSEISGSAGAVKEPVAPFVKELEFEYTGPDGVLATWSRKDELPARVRVRIGLGEDDEAGPREWFETEVALPVSLKASAE